jgi:hypothetical protein
MFCIAAFLLLNCLQALAIVREPLLLTADLNYLQVFQHVIHTLWLGPGLLIAVLLVLFALATRSSDKPKKVKILERQFRTPSLERFRGALPKNHQDLEI